MAVLIDTSFETGTLPFGFDSNTGTQLTLDSSKGVVDGTKALKCQNSGSTQFLQLNDSGGLIPAATKVLVSRFHFLLDTPVTAADTIVQGSNATGNFQLQARPGNKVRVSLFGTNSADSADLGINTPNYADLYFDAQGASAFIDWYLNGIAQTRLTVAGASAAFFAWRLGLQGTNTGIYFFDKCKVTNSAADFPLGSGATIRGMSQVIG